LEYSHKPVLVGEVVKYLVADPDGIYVDGTVGTGGHSLVIGKILSTKGQLICLDRDPEGVELSKQRLSFLGDRAKVFQANYAELDIILHFLGVKEVNGVLLDLGMSSHQLERSGRGFSFIRDEPLDMRMNPDDEKTARELVNGLSETALENILKNYGEEKRSKSIARAIVRARKKKPIETSLQLASLIESTYPLSQRHRKHPATRTFQALRIAVNRELDNIEIFLEKIPFLLAPKGRLVVISYHSLEDRLIKHAMVDWEKDCVCPKEFPKCVCNKVRLFRRLLKRAVKPGQREIEENPRARSALMRVAERMEP
jgi:16S rRNA (cytosine1402-N4)-methyltransferase